MMEKNKLEYTHSNWIGILSKQDEYEKTLNILGIKNQLKDLGWVRWQWRYGEKKSFVEVFSTVYNGYLRGDDKSLYEACVKVLNRAQNFAKCERTKGHKYEPMKNYDNGMIECVHCGFWGYAPEFKRLKDDLHWQKIRASTVTEKYNKLVEDYNILKNKSK